ncbi:MAG: stage II sporulation protein P [Oscillospiraceae bacterium]|nr:stage II sporulation protein P [Oscillospiraceae bacterium]
MGKLKSILIGAAAICCPFFAGTSTAAGTALRTAAYVSAGAAELPWSELFPSESDSESKPENSSTGSTDDRSSVGIRLPESTASDISSTRSSTVTSGAESRPPDTSTYTSEPNVSEPHQKLGNLITINRTESTADTDYSEFTKKSGEIYRYNFGKQQSEDYITLRSGAQVRNCTELENAVLSEAAEALPAFGTLDSEQPSVLIYHTHTSESFLPYGEEFDEDYPLRSGDPARNMTAVGDAICESLSKRGISSVHDCTVYDEPMFTGAYYRSADSMLEILEKYPSIKIVLDIHRDGIINADGSLVAPVAEIGGKNAAQFMIISGCDDGEMEMPDYMENFKLACLLQNCAEDAYPDLARAVLFDYRNYNQGLSTGALLIEVGSHGNSLDEAVYTGELLGNIIADALEKGAD